MIVIIEDDIALNKLIEIELAALGQETICFTAGKMAMHWILENHRDEHLYLIDYKLSDIDATELITLCRKRHPSLNFIVMTGYGNEDLVREMMTLGAMDYIAKGPDFVNFISHKINNAMRYQENLMKLSRLEQKLLNDIIEAEEKARRKFSEDIHDGLGPLLSTINLYADICLNEKDAERRHEHLDTIKEITSEAINQIRFIANSLMPPTLDDFGLVAAIEGFCERIGLHNILACNIETNLTERLPGPIEIILYRGITELINNSIKHSTAEAVLIKITIDQDLLKIKYTDNGCGFDFHKAVSQNEGLGLNNIISRIKSLGGTYHFDTSKGTSLSCTITLNKTLMAM